MDNEKRSTKDNITSSAGKPETRYTPARLTVDEIAVVDAWAERWRTSRASAMARLVEMGLGVVEKRGE